MDSSAKIGMEGDLFRRVSLERLASPEQLDQLLRVTDLRTWIGLTALFLMLFSGVIWGYKGSVVTTVPGQGIIVRMGGVLNIVSHGNGTVLDLNVHVGDRVSANAVVATVAQPALVEKRDAMRAALNEAIEERRRALEVRRNSGQLQVEAIARQRANNERLIAELGDQAELTKQQMAAEQRLLEKGLVTRQQTSAIQQKIISIQDQIASLNAQIKELDAQKFEIEAQPEREDREMRSRVSTIQRDLAAIEAERSMAENVVSPYGGQVLEVKVSTGSSVEAGQAIVSIQPDIQDLELLAFVPSLQAKNVKPGMQVQIVPSTVKREEYGFMRGTVVYVSDYPATTAALMRNFENELLVSTLTSAGPVTELRVRLERDASNPTGFKWSSSKGPALPTSSGTICSVQIVTLHQKPIALVFPYVKRQLGLE